MQSDSPGSQAPASPSSSAQPSLRRWVPIALLGLMVLTRFAPEMVEDGPLMLWMLAAFGPATCGIGVLLWWILASRATRKERLFGGLGLILGLIATVVLADPSVRGAFTLSITAPMGFAGFALAAVLGARLLPPARLAFVLLASSAGFGYSVLLRSEGIIGDFSFKTHWRWEASSEELLLSEASLREGPADSPLPRTGSIDLESPAWPGFRGPDRDGTSHAKPGSRWARDWNASPPELIWKTRVGPGWSSFAVAGRYLFTQEQRGDVEATICLAADSGERIWMREIAGRFDDALGGPGPRATPTLAMGALFVLGASGNLARLEASSGAVVWEQDLPEVAECSPPTWGFASSPLVTQGLVIVYAGGTGDKGLVAFDALTGELRWAAETGDQSYSSPELASLLGETHVLMLTNRGLDLYEPMTGRLALAYAWPFEGYRALQPGCIDESDVLVPTGPGSGTRRIHLARKAGVLEASEVWTSRDLKVDFNDFVIHEGNAYGFDGSMFTCVDLESGKRRWKQGRYGKGQVLLLEPEGLLLVASETGEVLLIPADPDGSRELGRIQALEGKTWNHPVVVEDRLYIRNSEEAACYRLPIEAPNF